MFRRPFFSAAGRLLGVGGLLIAGAAALTKEIERRQRERIDEELREQDEEIAEINRRAERQRQLDQILRGQDRSLPDDPVRLPRTAPGTRDTPLPIFLPAPEVLPDVGVPLPDQRPLSVPAPLTIPSPSPVPLPAPVGVPTPSPVGSPLPSPAPVPSPVLFPFSNPLPFLPFGRPTVGAPVGDPLTGIGGASVPFQPGAISLPQLQPGLQADRCPQRKCDDDLDEPRTECFKGLYREGIFDTDFTSWTEIDCVTGRELGRKSAQILDFPQPGV